ncbi:MAG TPA: chain length determinant protein tyrosine kinase EpsG [Methylophilaceae bacterium]|nr:chain length determinant protein tyrosine kinase EpsG [Methylophilaceae bacterium]
MNISQLNSPPIPLGAERDQDRHESERKAPLGQLLLKMGKLTEDEIERVLALQQQTGLRFGAAAKKLGLVSETDVQHALAVQFDYHYLHKSQEFFSKRLIAAYDPFSPQVEALRALRSQLLLRWFDDAEKVLAVVAANPGEGCSNLAANLAVVFSQLGERTLLIDANLREPDQRSIFNLYESRGLSDILAGRADLGVIHKIDSLSGLSVLGAGTVPPNPQELLSRKVFGEVLRRCREQYDVILVDTYPASMTSDAQTVAARCGGALLVSRLNQTRMAQLANVRDQLLMSEVEIVAAIVNDL